MNNPSHAFEQPMFTQAATINSVNEDDRTVEVIFSTGDLVPHRVVQNGMPRWMPTRVVVSNQAAKFDFLISGGPVLDSHQNYGARSVIGKVEEAWIDKGTARARLRISEAEDVDPIWQRIREGSARNVSMGFNIRKQELRTEQDAEGKPIEVMYFTEWEPVEISLVAVPADKGARIQGQTKKEKSSMNTSTLSRPPSDLQQFGQAHGLPRALIQSLEAASVALADLEPLAEDLDQMQQSISRLELEDGEVAELHQMLATDLSAGLRPGPDIVKAVRGRAVQMYVDRGQRQTQGIGGPTAAVQGRQRGLAVGGERAREDRGGRQHQALNH